MVVIFFLVSAVMLGSVFYQRIYFRDYQTVTKKEAVFKGWGYLFIFMLCGFMPILFVSQYGAVATVITSIIAIAATGGIFYLLVTKRTSKLSVLYPDDKLVGLKETFACVGKALYPFIAIFIIVFAIFFGVRSRRKK